MRKSHCSIAYLLLQGKDFCHKRGFHLWLFPLQANYVTYIEMLLHYRVFTHTLVLLVFMSACLSILHKSLSIGHRPTDLLLAKCTLCLLHYVTRLGYPLFGLTRAFLIQSPSRIAAYFLLKCMKPRKITITCVKKKRIFQVISR